MYKMNIYNLVTILIGPIIFIALIHVNGLLLKFNPSTFDHKKMNILKRGYIN